ncbi:hypothetical protein SteCoe_52 [Stentor coeruleus]|uniref:MARVEL domain-containing protein n=1 Tax=Stentor coeruleus TaxID=5963 RepID=A0A1R2D527_9CILI|nr:hypothetical protein SteCoe_52 [Stentor coeruleus]
MEEKRKVRMSKYRVATSTILCLIELAYISSISYVLTVNPGDCNTPIRLWLEVLLLIFAIHFILLVSTEILMPYYTKFLSGKICAFSASLNAFLCFFMVVWFVFGNYWYYNADANCSVQFYEGEAILFAILIIYYVFLGSACCLGCLLLILISLGSGITNRDGEF